MVLRMKDEAEFRAWRKEHPQLKIHDDSPAQTEDEPKKGKHWASDIKRGRRPDLGNRFFRSRPEANWARYLTWLNEPWEYEPTTFWFPLKSGNNSYKPDFFLPRLNKYQEVKGYMTRASQTKLKRMQKYHPGVVVELVTEAEYSEVERKVGALIPNWEF